MNNGVRGRPIGFKLSESTKRAISESKIGQKHSQETKDKISKTLMLYFRRLNPLSDEIESRYCRMDDDELCCWVNDARLYIDELDDVLTSRSMRNTRKTEIDYGQKIECFSHNLTPEMLMELREECAAKGIDVEDLINSMIE